MIPVARRNNTVPVFLYWRFGGSNTKVTLQLFPKFTSHCLPVFWTYAGGPGGTFNLYTFTPPSPPPSNPLAPVIPIVPAISPADACFANALYVWAEVNTNCTKACFDMTNGGVCDASCVAVLRTTVYNLLFVSLSILFAA